MAVAEAVVVEHGLEVSRLSVDRVGIVLDDGGGDHQHAGRRVRLAAQFVSILCRANSV